MQCQGLAHRLLIERDGTATALDHDEDAERIVMALGGQPPTCMTIVQAFVDPVALTPPNDPRFVAYCADPRFVSCQGMEQVETIIRYSVRTAVQRRHAHIKRTLLEAGAPLRMRWLLRWLDVVTDLPAGNALRASAEFVAYRIAGASGGPQPAMRDLPRVLSQGWEARQAGDGMPDWSVATSVV